MSQPHSTSLQIAATVQQGQKSALEVAQAALSRAESLQDRYRSFITLTPDLALRQATDVQTRLKAGEKLPLAGVPFAVKDLMHVAGYPTTCGSKVLRDNKSTSDANVVRRLVKAGAVLIGKLNMFEFAFGFTGENQHYGDCKNPWDVTRIPGGSSSGSGVAVATGICPLTLGSDTGGSIRMPSALCNVVGLKPTYGRVTRAGVLPLSWSMDHVGPMARTVEEVALALQIMAGTDPDDDSTSEKPVPDYATDLQGRLKGLKIGVQHAWFGESLEPTVAEAFAKALDKLKTLGAQIVEVDLPYLSEVVGAHRAIIFSEASSYHRPLLEKQSADYPDSIRPLLQTGLFLTAVEYLHAQRVRRLVRAAWKPVFDQIDALATPTLPMLAPKCGQQVANLPGGEKPLVQAVLNFTLPFNLSGHPAVSIPCGFADGQPIGLQLVGKPFGEGTILRIGHQYQLDTTWHQQVAPVMV